MKKADNLKEEEKSQSAWTGSKRTYGYVLAQIAERWGEDEAKNYEPQTNCLTIRAWNNKGFRVKKGEKALRSFTFIEVKDKETGELLEKARKPVFLFYEKQVEKVKVKEA